MAVLGLSFGMQAFPRYGDWSLYCTVPTQWANSYANGGDFVALCSGSLQGVAATDNDCVDYVNGKLIKLTVTSHR